MGKGQFTVWLHCFALPSSTKLDSKQEDASSSETFLTRLSSFAPKQGLIWDLHPGNFGAFSLTIILHMCEEYIYIYIHVYNPLSFAQTFHKPLATAHQLWSKPTGRSTPQRHCEAPASPHPRGIGPSSEANRRPSRRSVSQSQRIHVAPPTLRGGSPAPPPSPRVLEGRGRGRGPS